MIRPIYVVRAATISAILCFPALAQTTAAPNRNPFAGDVPRKPKPAFPGQTDAPAPSKPSQAIKVDVVTTRLNGPWSMALLPDGNFLVTESTGIMRIVRPDGVVSAPLAGLPGVKVVAARANLVDKGQGQRVVVHWLTVE